MKLLLWLMLRYKGRESGGCFGYVQGKEGHFACLNRGGRHFYEITSYRGENNG